MLKSYSQRPDIPPVRAADFDFHLPDELIAQHPTAQRDASRLLVLKRRESSVEHGSFRDLLQYLVTGDLLVLNKSRVIPARLRAANMTTGGRYEILLLEENSRNDWWALMRPAKRAPVGRDLRILDQNQHPCSINATVVDTNADGHRRLLFNGTSDIGDVLDELGETPLPPYIQREGHELALEDQARYQTVYARDKGSVAAPTAGLHFTTELLAEIRARGVEVCFITLHVGPGTFAPVKTEHVEEHAMHHERFHVDDEAASMINAAKSQHRRVLAVGTTTVRVLETVARENHGKVAVGSGRTNIFIFPPYEFRIVDALLTNFHLPRSTLLMLVSAFVAPGETSGREIVLSAYEDAVKQRYRFFSYGDAMLIL